MPHTINLTVYSKRKWNEAVSLCCVSLQSECIAEQCNKVKIGSWIISQQGKLQDAHSQRRARTAEDHAVNANAFGAEMEWQPLDRCQLIQQRVVIKAPIENKLWSETHHPFWDSQSCSPEHTWPASSWGTQGWRCSVWRARISVENAIFSCCWDQHFFKLLAWSCKVHRKQHWY